MITINKPPYGFVLAGNPVFYDVSSDNFLAGAGAYGRIYLVVTGTDTVAGHYFTISFNNQDLLFTLAEAPDDSGLQLPVALVGDTFETWCAKIFSALLENYDLQTNYDIILGSSMPSSRSILLMAKEKGDEWSLAFVNNDVVGIADYNNIAGVDPDYRSNFRIVGTIWTHIDDRYEKLFEDEKSVDSLGHVMFDFSEYLSARLLPDPQTSYLKEYRVEFPELTDAHINIRDNYVLVYMASFAEKFAGEVQKLHWDGPNKAIPGGLNTEMLLVFNAYNISYFEYPGTYPRFLTWKPLVKKTTTDMVEKLFFFLFGPRDPHIYALKCKIYYESGEPASVSFDSGSLSNTVVLECKVGYSQLDLGSYNPDREVIAWEIWLETNEGDGRSETHRYELDKRSYEYERRFLFRNSFHTYDTIRLTGKRDSNLQYERSSGSTYSGRRLSFDSWPIRNFKNKEQQSFKDNSGWITALWKDYMREFLLSTEIYEILGERLVPVIIRNSKFTPFLQDGMTLYDLSLEYDRAFDDEFYSSIHELDYILENGFWDDQGIWKDDRQWID